MNTIFLIISILIMITSISTFIIILINIVNKEISQSWLLLSLTLFFVGILLLPLSIQNWRYEAMQFKKQLIEQNIVFFDFSFKIRHPICKNYNLPVMQKQLIIHDGMDYTYWVVVGEY